MPISRYHRFLRTALLVSALVLVFDSGMLFPITKKLSDNTITYVASSIGSGVFASVPSNEINTLTAQISERQRILDAREAQLREREIASRLYNTEDETDYSTYIVSIILFVLTVLVVLNYAMDFARIKRFTYEKSVG